MFLSQQIVSLSFLLASLALGPGDAQRRTSGEWRDHSQSWYVRECMQKILDVIQPCHDRAISIWNLNHSLFVPSRLSQCCANWEVYDCFIQASLENCDLLEFQSLVLNMTADALDLQRRNCSRFRYHSEECAAFSSATMSTVQWPLLALGLAFLIWIRF